MCEYFQKERLVIQWISQQYESVYSHHWGSLKKHILPLNFQIYDFHGFVGGRDGRYKIVGVGFHLLSNTEISDPHEFEAWGLHESSC